MWRISKGLRWLEDVVMWSSSPNWIFFWCCQFLKSITHGYDVELNMGGWFWWLYGWLSWTIIMQYNLEAEIFTILIKMIDVILSWTIEKWRWGNMIYVMILRVDFFLCNNFKLDNDSLMWFSFVWCVFYVSYVGLIQFYEYFAFFN